MKERLIELSDKQYKAFQEKLIPHCNNILGVRIPILRKIAKTIVKEDWKTYLQHANDDSFEEIMLQGFVIGYSPMGIEEKFYYIEQFIPKISNWSVCDSFCSTLKIAKQHQEVVWDFVLPYLSSQREFSVRFAIVMLLNYFINKNYIQKVLEQLDQISHEGYYVKMANAWAISKCFIKFPSETTAFLKTNYLDTFTYNKALQKIIESYQVDEKTKEWIRSIK